MIKYSVKMRKYEDILGLILSKLKQKNSTLSGCRNHLVMTKWRNPTFRDKTIITNYLY